MNLPRNPPQLPELAFGNMDFGATESTSFILQVARLCIRLSNAESESQVFCRLIEAVDSDLKEAIRLRRTSVVCSQLELNPGDKAYFDGAISRTQTAIQGIETFVANSDIEKNESEPSNVDNRANWVLMNQTKLASRHYELEACHDGLMRVVARMQGLKDKVAVFSQEQSTGDCYRESEEDGKRFVSPHQRRVGRAREARMSGKVGSANFKKSEKNSMFLNILLQRLAFLFS